MSAGPDSNAPFTKLKLDSYVASTGRCNTCNRILVNKLTTTYKLYDPRSGIPDRSLTRKKNLPCRECRKREHEFFANPRPSTKDQQTQTDPITSGAA